jgi:isopenicillin-N epimerase
MVEDWLTTQEAAEISGYNLEYVRRLVRNGKLEARNFGPVWQVSRFSLIHEMWGTRDISAFLSVPAAINFQEEHNWHGVRKECHDLLIDARRKIIELSGQPAIAPEDQG